MTLVLDDTRPDTRARILTEAERLFRHYGYTKTTVADIARELGMSSANIYRFFPSKLAINAAICEQILDNRMVALLQIARKDISVVDRLREIILTNFRMTVDVLLVEQKVHEMVSVAMDENWDCIRLHIEKQTELLTRLLAEGMDRGEIRRGDPLTLAKCLQQGFVSLFHPLLVARCNDGVKATPEELIDFLLFALRP